MPNPHIALVVVITNLWSIVLDVHWSKKTSDDCWFSVLYSSQMNLLFNSGAIDWGYPWSNPDSARKKPKRWSLIPLMNSNKLVPGWFLEWVTISMNTGVKFNCPVKNGGTWIINSEVEVGSRTGRNQGTKRTKRTKRTRWTKRTKRTKWTKRTRRTKRTKRTRQTRQIGLETGVDWTGKGVVCHEESCVVQNTLLLPCQKAGETKMYL